MDETQSKYRYLRTGCYLIPGFTCVPLYLIHLGAKRRYANFIFILKIKFSDLVFLILNQAEISCVEKE